MTPDEMEAAIRELLEWKAKIEKSEAAVPIVVDTK
jgi:hypothetical protein